MMRANLSTNLRASSLRLGALAGNLRLAHRRKGAKKASAFLAILLILSLASTVIPQQKKSTGLFDENTLRAHIKFLSDDSLEGRGTGARGGEIAAKYIASQLERLGLKGAGKDGSFFQPVSLYGVKS